MNVRDVESGFVIRLERGEKVLAALNDFCAKRGILSGFFHGIGAVKNTELGYYSLTKKEYFFKTITEDREVASMTGNVTSVDEKPFVHAHAVLSASDESISCIGGHIKECEVAITLEVFLVPFSATITRQLDENIGLKLLSL